MLEQIQIEDFQNMYHDTPRYYQYWIIIFGIIIVCFAMFLNYFQYDFYHSVKMYYIDGKIHVRVFESDVSKFLHHKTVQINHKDYPYTIKEMSEPILNHDIYALYHDIVISIDLEKNLQINNNYIEGKILLGSKNGLEIIRNFIFGKDR